MAKYTAGVTWSTSAVVTLWDARKAMDAYFARHDLPVESQFNDNGSANYERTDWNSFLLPLAGSFADFLEMLTDSSGASVRSKD